MSLSMSLSDLYKFFPIQDTFTPLPLWLRKSQPDSSQLITGKPLEKAYVEGTIKKVRTKSLSQLPCFLGVLVFGLAALWIGFLVLSPIITTTRLPATLLRRPCGNSSAEAKSLGCEFDVISFCWLPEECLDRELTEEFRQAGDWRYYTDLNKTSQISEEEFGNNEKTVFLTNELHVAHCAFDLMKFHRALANGRKIHSEQRLSHTHHCSHAIRSSNDPYTIENSALIQFPDCGYFSTSFPQ